MKYVALAFMAAVVAAAVSVAAHATTYQLEHPVYPVGVDYAAHASMDPAVYLGAAPFTLRISSAAVQRGHFDFEARWAWPTTGDVADFIGFQSYDYSPSVEDLRISLRFDAAGNIVTGSSLLYMTDLVELDLSGDANSFGGLFILGANSSYRGHLSGQLLDPPDAPDPTGVPEAGTIQLFVTALGALAFGRLALFRR